MSQKSQSLSQAIGDAELMIEHAALRGISLVSIAVEISSKSPDENSPISSTA
jgi:hypothetical protein